MPGAESSRDEVRPGERSLGRCDAEMRAISPCRAGRAVSGGAGAREGAIERVGGCVCVCVCACVCV